MCNLFGVVVLHRSILDCRGSICHGHMCILLYAYLFGVMVLHKSMVNWRRGKGSVCHGYMCLLLYMKLLWCSGVA